MTVQALAALASPEAAAVLRSQPVTSDGFATVLESLQQLNTQMQANDQSIQQLALGGTDNLHQVMMTLERTRLAFELALQVRNKALEAYQELMRMQV
jgi:flagellar hook-basal body complex protein FliE